MATQNNSIDFRNVNACRCLRPVRSNTGELHDPATTRTANANWLEKNETVSYPRTCGCTSHASARNVRIQLKGRGCFTNTREIFNERLLPTEEIFIYVYEITFPIPWVDPDVQTD